MESNMKRKFLLMLAAVLVGSMLLAACQYQIGGTGTTPEASPPPSGSPSETILGIQGDVTTSTAYSGIPWVRLAYPTCGSSNSSGQVLKDTISSYHNQGMHVLL